jgi:hypothetical protein
MVVVCEVGGLAAGESAGMGSHEHVWHGVILAIFLIVMSIYGQDI